MVVVCGAVPIGRCLRSTCQAVSFLRVRGETRLGGRFATSFGGAVPVVLVLIGSMRESRIRGDRGTRWFLPSAPNPLLPPLPTPLLAALEGRMLQQLATVSSSAVYFYRLVLSVFIFNAVRKRTATATTATQAAAVAAVCAEKVRLWPLTFWGQVSPFPLSSVQLGS